MLVKPNGICKGFHRALKEELYDITFRKHLYTSLDELQLNLDKWFDDYNNLRPHSGKFCYGKTPMQTFLETKHVAQEKNYGNINELSDSSTYSVKAA
jgi:hypothetical protein